MTKQVSQPDLVRAYNLLRNAYLGDNAAMAEVQQLLDHGHQVQVARARVSKGRDQDVSAGAHALMAKGKAQAASVPFWMKLVPWGIGAAAFLIGFFIVMPIVSMVAVPLYGFIVGVIVFGGGVLYARHWAGENLPQTVKQSNAGL